MLATQCRSQKRKDLFLTGIFSIIQRLFLPPPLRPNTGVEECLQMSVNAIWSKADSLNLVSFMAFFKQEATLNTFHSSKVAAGVFSLQWLSSKVDWLQQGNSLLLRSTVASCPYVCNLYVNLTTTWSQQEFRLLPKFRQNYVYPLRYGAMHLY